MAIPTLSKLTFKMLSLAKILTNNTKSLLLLKREPAFFIQNFKMSEGTANGCLIPQKRHDKIAMHESFVSKANACKNCDVVLIGDSIVEALTSSRVFQKYAPKEKTILNFGIGGDRVEHILYRIEDGNWLEKLKPKLLVLFVGTNNTNSKPEDISEGIQNIVKVVKGKVPDTIIVLPLLHPKGKTPNKYREIVCFVNKLLVAKYSSNKDAHIVDTDWSKFIDGGVISDDLMYDYLHLTDRGYGIGWKPVLDDIDDLLKKHST